MLLILKISHILLLLFIFLRPAQADDTLRDVNTTSNTKTHNITIENKYMSHLESVKREETKKIDVVNGEKKEEDKKSEEISTLMEASSTTIQGSVPMSMLDIYKKCQGKLVCIEEKLLSVIEELDKRKTIPLLSHIVTVEKTSTKENETPETAKAKEGLLARIYRYLINHSIGIKLNDEDDDEDDEDDESGDQRSVPDASSRNLGEGRTRKKKLKKQQKILMPFIMFLELAFFVIVPNILWATFVVAVPSLLAAISGLLISTFFAVQSIWQDKESSPSTRLTLVKPHVIPELYHPWSRTSLLDPYRGYGPSP